MPSSVSLCVRVQYGDGKKRRKPNYSSVDLSEVEWEDKDDTVRDLWEIHSVHYHGCIAGKVTMCDTCSVALCRQLRNAMVNRKTGDFSMEVKKSVDKGVRNSERGDAHVRPVGVSELTLVRKVPLCRGGPLQLVRQCAELT